MKKEQLEKLVKYLEEFLSGKINKEELAQKTGIDFRYLNTKISQLKDTHPELYARYTKQYPYRTGEITHIDYEAAVIEMLKQGENVKNIVERYKEEGLRDRTFRRKISQMRKTNPELFDLYTVYARNK